MSRFFSLVRATPSPVVGSSPAYYVLVGQQPAAYMAAYDFATLGSLGRTNVASAHTSTHAPVAAPAGREG